MFLHSLPCNVEFGPKSIFRSELIKVWCSCIPWLEMWHLAPNPFYDWTDKVSNFPAFLDLYCGIWSKINFWEWIDKGSMFLHSLPCNVEFGPKSSFRIELIKFDVPAFLGFLCENLAKNQFLKQTDKGFMFLYSLAFNVEFGPKSIHRSKLVKVDCSCIPWLEMWNLVINNSLIPWLVMWKLAQNQFLKTNW